MTEVPREPAARRTGPGPVVLSTLLASLLAILRAPVALVVWLWCLPEGLLTWVALHGRNTHRWRGFGRRSRPPAR